MYEGYKDKQKRIDYMREYRKKNRKRLNAYLLNYLDKSGKSYYKHKCVRLGRCGMGRKYELLALNTLNDSVDCNADNFHGKYDIVWNSMRIDVKSKNYDRRMKCWRFTLRNTDCFDALLLYCVLDGQIQKMILIPVSVLPNDKALQIYRNSKYDKYIIRVNN